MTTLATPPPSRLARLARGVGALIVLVAIVAGVPILMLATGLAPHGLPSLHELKHDLTSRDNGQLAIVAIAIGVWVCWALFTLSLIPELVALARKRPAYSLPVLGAFQRPACVLVTAVAIGFAIAPLVTGLGNRAAAAPPPGPHPHRSVSAAGSPLRSPTGPASASAEGHRDGTGGSPTHAIASQHSAPLQQYPTYRVRRRDTLWQIAAEHLGDPLRYTEIVALNPDTIGTDNTIRPDTILRLPQDATGVPGTARTAGVDAATDGHTPRVVVERGDTLSGIVEHVTGSKNWHPTWAANVGRHEADGHVLTDPNIIWPGDVIDVPPAASETTPAAPPATPTSTPQQQGHRPAPAPAPDQPAGKQPGHGQPTPTQPARAAPPTTTPTSQRQHPARADNHQVSTESGSRYVALTAGGGLLAATTFAAIMVLRRRKFRHRRPGHVVASLPPELMPLEQALVAAGRPALPKMTFFDLALRDLAARIETDPDGALPDVIGAAINDTYLELYLAPPSAGVASPVPPDPWLETAPQRWTLSRDAALDPAASTRLAPYPCLVSVAYTADGTEFLLDLEHAGAVQLTGDPARCLDLARYLVAELANNLWSDHLTVTVCGFARELLDANPTRLAYSDDPHAAAIALARVAGDNRAVAGDADSDVLGGRLRGTDGDVWMPHVLLAAPGVPGEDVRLLRESVAGGRAAVAVVLSVGRGADDAAHDGLESGAQVHLTADGELMTELLPVADLTALGLPEVDAPDLARAIALDRDGVLDEPTPPADGDQPCDAFVDAAGALLPEFTMPRAASGPSVIDPAEPVHSSVLPGPDETYVSSAATTEEDLAQLAPAVTAQTRAAVEQADPDLDELLAAWHDPQDRRARLRMLGPVTVTAFGRAPDKQEDLCAEIVAYLWHHPRGVSTDQFANDLWPEQNYTGTDSNPKNMASRVRHWLDVCPDCGNEYLPRARRDGVQGYRLCCVLCDVDLFRRLRARGEARGADGLPDLLAALELVSGTPLSQLRKFGYGWLPAGDELLYQGAVSEVAHLVATHALAAGEDGEALRACELALTFNVEDDYALLQMVKTHERAGRDAEKEATILRLRTLDDPPLRTVEVMRRNGWLSRGA